jgi:hypothetical protein
MNQSVSYVDKTTDTFADVLLTYGVAALLDTLLRDNVGNERYESGMLAASTPSTWKHRFSVSHWTPFTSGDQRKRNVSVSPSEKRTVSSGGCTVTWTRTFTPSGGSSPWQP